MRVKYLVIKTQELGKFKTWTDDEKLLTILNWVHFLL